MCRGNNTQPPQKMMIVSTNLFCQTKNESSENDELVISLFALAADAAPGEGLLVPFVGRQHVRSVMDTQDGHLICILEVLKELGCDEEVLGGCLLAGCPYNNVKDSPFIDWVHTLVDLVHHSEGTAVELLQGHEVEHCGDTALPSTLVVCCELMELRAATEFHPDTDPVFIILLLVL